MSLVTVSEKKQRVYKRAFDHDECQRLRAEDPRQWTYQRLADHFAVSLRAVSRVLNERERERMAAYSLRWMYEHKREPCKGGCGRLVWLINASRSGYCTACVGALRAAPNVRPDELRCAACGEWKPDAEFYRRRNKARRGRVTECKPCANARRRAYREQHYEAEQAYWRLTKQGERREREERMSKFIVFQPNGKGFVELERIEAANAAHAVEQIAKEAGQYVAVLESRFKVMRVEPVQRLTVVSDA